jgi:putative phosphoribosyl transferase
MGKLREVKRFKNREEAYQRTIEELDPKLLEGALILSLSDDGDYYAQRLSQQFRVPWDQLILERIYSHINPETILGAITETRDYLIVEEFREAFELSDDYLYSKLEETYEERILPKVHRRRGHRLNLQNRRVVLVDESSETGLRAMTGIKACYNRGVEHITLIIPIISKESREVIENLVDFLATGLVVEEYVTEAHYFEEMTQYCQIELGKPQLGRSS